MVRAVVGCITATVFLLVSIIWLGALGFDPWRGPKSLIWTQAEIKRASADDIRVQCLALEMWHAEWLNGSGNLEVAQLIGVVARNLASTKPTDQCTVFSQGLAMLPTKTTAYITRSVEVVSGQAMTKARSLQYASAVDIAQTIISAREPVSTLKAEFAKARCAKKFLRTRWGYLISLTAGSRDSVKAALESEYGPPVLTTSDGTEFFGKCP